MKTKDEIAKEKYGVSYEECCWRLKARVDGIYAGQEEAI